MRNLVQHVARTNWRTPAVVTYMLAMTDSNRQTDHHEQWFSGKIVSRWWKHWCSTRPLERTVQLFCCLSIFRIEIKTMIGSQTQWMIETIGHPSQIFSFCSHLLKRLWSLKTSLEFSLNWWHLGCPPCSHLAFMSNKNNLKERFFWEILRWKKDITDERLYAFQENTIPQKNGWWEPVVLEN